VKRQQWMPNHHHHHHYQPLKQKPWTRREKPIEDKHRKKVTCLRTDACLPVTQHLGLGTWDTYVCIQCTWKAKLMVFRHFSIKPMIFSTCSVEEKEHRVLVLSLSPSPSPLPSWIEKANLVTKDKHKPEAKVASSLRWKVSRFRFAISIKLIKQFSDVTWLIVTV
jgi:hypothetical protein